MTFWLILCATAGVWAVLVLFLMGCQDPTDDPEVDRPEEQELRFDADAILAEQAAKPARVRNTYLINRALDEKWRQMNREAA